MYRTSTPNQARIAMCIKAEYPPDKQLAKRKIDPMILLSLCAMCCVGVITVQETVCRFMYIGFQLRRILRSVVPSL